MYKWLFAFVLIIAVAAVPGCRRTGGGPAYYGGEDENVVEGSVVVGEIVPADTDVGEEIDEFAEGGEFSSGAVGTVEATEVPGHVAEPAPTGATGTVDGYRVQVIASSYQDNADNVAGQVRAAFGGVGVYVEHVQGLYKVRVGDYKDRVSAEAMRDRLRNAGYADAWIVKEPVNQ
ncbi:MAG TPA: SPOR domain-containing protein [bacterium]|nr:SPOR domain-containing protein [bacterium]